MTAEKLTKRAEIINYFRQVAQAEMGKMNQVIFDHFLNKDDKGRVLYVMPTSAGDIFLSTALFKSIKKRYPDWALYVATKREYKEILDGNPYVDKWLEYIPQMDSQIWAIGNNSHQGFFNVSFHPYGRTQRLIDYLGEYGLIDFDLNYKT